MLGPQHQMTIQYYLAVSTVTRQPISCCYLGDYLSQDLQFLAYNRAIYYSVYPAYLLFVYNYFKDATTVLIIIILLPRQYYYYSL